MRAGSEVSVQPLDLIVITIGRNHVNFKRVFAGYNIEVGNVVHFDCAKDWVPLILAMQIQIEDEMIIDKNGSLAGSKVVEKLNPHLCGWDYCGCI